MPPNLLCLQDAECLQPPRRSRYNLRENPALTLSELNCYGAQSMLRRLPRYLLLLLAILALGFFFYKFRNSISLEGFHWGMVGQSLREARISLLLLAVAAIYVCYAIRALRWMRFSRMLGATHFGNVYGATLMGFTVHVSDGSARRADSSCVDRQEGFALHAGNVRRVRP